MSKKYSTVFDLVHDVFRRSGAKFILIGGFAVNYYKVTRQTLDIDFLCTKEHFNKIKGSLEAEGYKTYREEANFIQLENDKPGLMAIDFMFVDFNTFDKIKTAGKEIKIAGQDFIIPSLFHLIALKLHSIKNNQKRELTDFPDIARLIVNNSIDVREPDFRSLCLKYGTEEIYERIKKLI